MTLTEMVYGILFQPVSTLQYLSREKPLSRAMLVFVSVLLFNTLVNQAISMANIEELPFSLPVNLLWLFGLMGIIFSILLLFLTAGFFSLLSEVFFGRANARIAGLFRVCFSSRHTGTAFAVCCYPNKAASRGSAFSFDQHSLGDDITGNGSAGIIGTGYG